MGPRCTQEIPGRIAEMHVVSSCAAGSPEFRLSSQAFLSDWSGSEPSSAHGYSRSSRLLMHNQVGSGRTPAEGALLIKHRPALASTPACSLTTATRCYNGPLCFLFAMWCVSGLSTKQYCPDVNSRLGPYKGPNTTTFEILVTGNVSPLIMPSGIMTSNSHLSPIRITEIRIFVHLARRS